MGGKLKIYHFFIVVVDFRAFLLLLLIEGVLIYMDVKKYNGIMERLNRIGTPKERRKKYKDIVKEMGSRNITLEDISSDAFNGKFRGFLDMMDEKGMTMDEALVLQQYAKAITQQDTKAAEFIRDTAGEKPSTNVNMNVEDTPGISSMSTEELLELKKNLEMNIALSKLEEE